MSLYSRSVFGLILKYENSLLTPIDIFLFVEKRLNNINFVDLLFNLIFYRWIVIDKTDVLYI
jgi:hypothetical protein